MTGSLSGLLGRFEFLDTLDSAIRGCEGPAATPGLLVIDIDHFGNLNAVLGFRQTNQLLKTIAARLLGIKKAGDIAGHIGDHAFALILPDMGFPDMAELAAIKIVRELDDSCRNNDIVASVHTTVGIALYPDHGVTGEHLLIAAKSAVHAARRNNERYLFAGNFLQETILRNQKLELDLDSAIKNAEFELYYQPKVNLTERQPSGAEALIRWHHPAHGTIGPGRFMSIVEHSPVLLPVTLWTLNTALHQAADIRQFLPNFRVAVNLSAGLLDTPDIVDLGTRALRTWGTEPHYLVLEVTESAMMQNPEICLHNLQRLNEAGVLLSIDDFGTGYSSLSYLKRLPIQELKIDRSFISNMMENESDTQIVQAIINLGRQFNLSVVAEGIESREVGHRLIDMGCQYGQGYLIARPLSFAQLLKWIRQAGWHSAFQAPLATG
jgi:diguanylate cyclase (GGDEF)-like protein